MNVLLVHPDEMDEVWPQVLPLIAKAFTGLHVDSIEDYLPRLKDATLQLFVAVEYNKVIGAFVTSLDEGSGAKICNVLKLGGENLALWIHKLDDKLTEFAKINNCDAIEYAGRRGFTHFLPEYEESAVVYVKRL